MNSNTLPKWYNNPAGWRKPATLVDGYKCGHIHQYPEGTEIIVSNYTPRSTRRDITHVVAAGPQYLVKEYLISLWNTAFFSRPVEEVVGDFVRRINAYLPGNNIGEQHIRDLHALGYLPICILALPEGTVYPLKLPSLMIWNTKKEFFWLTNYLETIISTTLWGMSTSATTAHQYKKLLTKYALETVGDAGFVPWQGHDFSFRGMFGLEAAAMSGTGHLFSFNGTDTVPAIDFAEFYYNAGSSGPNEIIGGSVAATEHSVACSTILDFVRKVRIEKTAHGETIVEDELMNLADIEYVKHLITVVYPTGIVSIVADSFDYWNTITNTARVLKDVILCRNGKVVFRPDTGDPVKVVVGEAYPTDDVSPQVLAAIKRHFGHDYIKYQGEVFKIERADVDTGSLSQYQLTAADATPILKGSIECLWDIFGGTTTSTGYKLLDSHVGLIYGDSITLERAEYICAGLKAKGFASINIVFGIGSFTYQYVTRDTDGYAIKATWALINGEPVEIYKSPKGAAFKKSAKGLTAVFQDDDGEFYLKDQATWDEVNNCELVKIFEDGKLLVDYTLQDIRDKLNQYV